MRKSFLSWLVLTVLLITACDAPDSIVAAKAKLLPIEDCPQQTIKQAGSLKSVDGEPGPGCPVETVDVSGEQTVIGPASTSESQFPEFAGQTLTFDDVANSPGSYWGGCADVLTNVRFLRVTNGVIETFQTTGNSYMIGTLPPMGDGFPRAVYQLPSRTVYSTSGHYYAFGGSVNVVCIHSEYDFTVLGYGWIVNVDAYRVNQYNGTIRVSGVSDTGPTSGWAYYNSQTGFSNGSSDGWSAALGNFLADHTCSLYWDVWVDGRQVCANGQYQS